MAGEVERLSGKLGLDTTDFKTAVGAANREMRVLESSFKASAAALVDWTKDATGLESRVKTLTNQIDIQKLKVNALRAEHQRLVEANGENSRAAQDAEIKLNKETESLNKMQVELNGTEEALQEMESGEVEAGDAAEESGEQAEESGSKWEKLKPILAGVGIAAAGLVTGIAAVGAAAIAAVGAIGAMVVSAANAAADLVDLSAQTGISTTRLQELAFVGDQVGTSLDTITGAQARLIRSMAGAQDGTGEQAKAFKELGVSVTDAGGNLRDTQAVFANVIDSLGKIQNPAERDALAMQIFGKSALELNPLIKAGSDEMARLSKEAHEVGAVMSEEDVAALEAFDDTLASLQAGLKGTLGTLASAFLPGFQAVFNQAGGYLKKFSQIVSGADGDFGKIAEGLTGLVTEIATDLAKKAPEMLQAGLAIVQSILDAIIAALPQMLTAGTAILTSLINFIVQALPTLLQAGVQILLTLINAIIANLPMLIDAALQAVLTLANGIAEALPTLIPAVVQAVLTIVQTLIDNLPLLIEAAIALIRGLAEGLIAALPILLEQAPVIIQSLSDVIIEQLPVIAKAAGEIISTLALAIIQNLPTIISAALQIIKAIFDTIGPQAQVKALFEIGKGLLDGIWKGVQANWEAFKAKFKEAFDNLIAFIKEQMGIASPSKVGIEIGKNFIGSVGLGGIQMLPAVEKMFTLASQRMAMATAGPSNNYNSSTQNENFSFYAPVIMQGSTPEGSLGARLKGRRY
jgi:phage-related protein